MGKAGAHGRAAETMAASYLELAGLEVLDRNVRMGGVEVDVLAADRHVAVVVEVKFRSRSDYGGAAWAVDRAKRERLVRAASVLLARGHGEVRIDVVTVQLRPEGAEVHHLRGAVSA